MADSQQTPLASAAASSSPPPPPPNNNNNNGGIPPPSNSDGYTFTPIRIGSEVASEEARMLDAALVPFPLFDSEEAAPLLPLYEVEYDFSTDSPGLFACCQNFTKIAFVFFNYIAMAAYPCAVIYKEHIRFLGYIAYYFCVVPSRYYANYVAKPCVDSYYRYMKPKIVWIQLLYVRPCIAIWAQFCRATWAPCCNRPKSYKAEAQV